MKIKNLWRGLGLLLVVALFATACGSSGTTSVAAQAEEPAAEEEPVAEEEAPAEEEAMEDDETITLGVITKFPHPFFFAIEDAAQAVSYTHLTLPTICSV